MEPSEKIRKLARLVPIQEKALDSVLGDPIVDESTLLHEGYEYFWRSRNTEVQEAHQHHLDGEADLYEGQHIDSLEGLPQFSELGGLAQDFVPKHGLDPTDQTVPDLE